MRVLRSAVVIALAASSFACDTEEEEELGPPTLMAEADVTEVAPGDTITLTFHVENFSFSGEDGDGHDHDHGELQRGFDPELVVNGDAVLAEGDHDHDHDHDHGDYDGPRVGHVHVYLDDLMTNPIGMLTTRTGEVTIDANTAAGSHTLICRLHSADHKIEPQIIDELDIEVQVP